MLEDMNGIIKESFDFLKEMFQLISLLKTKTEICKFLLTKFKFNLTTFITNTNHKFV